MTINGSNTYTGSTNVNGATLILGANNVLSNSSALNISGGHFNAGGSTQTLHSLTMTSGLLTRNGGTLRFNNASSLTGGTVNIGNSGGSIVTGGALTLGNVTFTYNASTDGLNALSLGGDVAVGNGGTATMSNGPAGGRGYIKLGDANRVFDVGANANLNVNWLISSANLALGALTKNGSGTLTLNAFNEYTGGMTVNAGTLVLGHATNTLANAGAVTVNGGTLSLGSNNDTIGALTLTGGSITGTTGVLTASSYALQNGTVSAILGGSASINKTTAGTVTLSAANTFSGGITLGGGTLVLGNANAAGSGVITQTSGSSVLSIDTGGMISNTMIVSNVLARQSTTLNGSITVNNATFDVENGDTLTISGVVSGSGGVTKTGNGTLILSGSNSYNGSTVVNAGTLNANIAGALGANNAVQVNGGSLLVSANGSLNSKSVTLNSTSTNIAGLAFSGNYSGRVNNLTLSQNSIIDLGEGSVSIMFDTFVMSTYMLDIYNWTGTTLWNGGTGNDPDKVYFGPDLSDEALAKIRFHSGAVGVGDSFLGSGFELMPQTTFDGGLGYQILPVPEPETWATAVILLVGGVVWFLKRARNPLKKKADPLITDSQS
jgi:autotransporter-associated beta strand protein